MHPNMGSIQMKLFSLVIRLVDFFQSIAGIGSTFRTIISVQKEYHFYIPLLVIPWTPQGKKSSLNVLNNQMF